MRSHLIAIYFSRGKYSTNSTNSNDLSIKFGFYFSYIDRTETETAYNFIMVFKIETMSPKKETTGSGTTYAWSTPIKKGRFIFQTEIEPRNTTSPKNTPPPKNTTPPKNTKPSKKNPRTSKKSPSLTKKEMHEVVCKMKELMDLLNKTRCVK